MEPRIPVEPPAPAGRRRATLNGSLAELRAWALPGSFAGEETEIARRTLFFLSLGLMVMAAFSLTQAWSRGWMGSVCTYSVEELWLIAAFWVNRQGKVEWATKIICFSELACGLILIAHFGAGFSDEELILFPLIVVTAAMLMDWRSYITFAGLVVVSVAITGFILAATGTRGTSYNRVTNTVNILVITVVASGLQARNLKRSLSLSREAERKVKTLSGRLINVQEEERARIARELHDDLSQQIAAVSIAMSNLKRQIPDDQASGRAQSDHIQEKLVEVAETVRRMSHELHPTVLQYVGLAAALRSYSQEFGVLTGVQVSVAIDGEFNGIPPGAALCIYRITQEALRNVAKHAGVATAAVDLRHSDGLLILTVSDQGVGMDPARAEATAGLGLISIRERTRLAGGNLQITSKPNQGTIIKVRIPDGSSHSSRTAGTVSEL